MALKQTKVAVGSTNGGCNTLCNECSVARGVIAANKTVLNDGVLLGSIVPRATDNLAIWIEGCQCYVNFEYEESQLVTGTILLPCDICLVCGCVVTLIDAVSSGVAGPAGPAGPTGPQGIQGIQGIQGTPGAGTATVISVIQNVDGSFSVTQDGVAVGVVIPAPPTP